MLAAAGYHVTAHMLESVVMYTAKWDPKLQELPGMFNF